MTDPTHQVQGRYPHDRARAARLLAVHPGPVLTTDLAAPLIGTSETDARTWLSELARDGLLAHLGQGRYTHRLPGRDLTQDLTEADHHHAINALVQYFRLRLAAAAAHLSPGRLPVDTGGAALAAIAQQATDPWFEDVAEVATWLRTHRDNLRAVTRMAFRLGRHTVVWQIADHLGECAHTLPTTTPTLQGELYPLALEAAREHGGLSARARMHQRMYTLAQGRRHTLYHGRCAREYYIAGGDAHGVASATVDLGVACAVNATTDDLLHAEHLLMAAEHRFWELNHGRGAAIAALERGQVHAQRGHPDAALATLGRAQHTLKSLEGSDHFQMGRCLMAQARIHHQGQTERAGAVAHAALVRFRAAHAPEFEALARALITNPAHPADSPSPAVS